MTRILLVTDNPTDGISFYRSVMPWNQIQKDFDDIVVTVKHPSEVFTWNVLTSNDILFISNPRIMKHLEIIKAAKNYGLAVWSDYDDCYIDIPQDNQSFNILTAGHVTHTTKECLMESTVTTVTTNYLKEVFSPYTDRIEVVPNAFPSEFLSDSSLGAITQGSFDFVSWRGSNSHAKNLEDFSHEITEVAQSNPGWIFKFFGFNPWFLNGRFKYNHYGFEHMFDSFYRLKKFSSKIHIVTLHESAFNLSKSNIAWIESTIAGSVVLAPDWEEWRKPGIVNYSSKEDFKVKLQGLLNGEYNLTKHFEESREYILNNLSLKKVNRERIKILQQLCVSKSDYRA